MKKQIAKTLFINSFQKEIRNKTFWFLLVSSLLVMLTSKAFFAWFTSQIDLKLAFGSIDLHFYYFIVFLWTGLMAALLGVNALKSDTRYGMSEQIMAFPLRSESYLLLRLLGTSLIVWFFYLLLFVMMALFLFGSQALSLFAIFSPFVFFFFIFAMVLLGGLLSLYLGSISGFVALILTALIVSFINQHLGSFNTFYPIALLIHIVVPPLGTVSELASLLVFKTPMTEGTKLWLIIPHYLLSMGFLFWLTNFLFKRRGYK